MKALAKNWRVVLALLLAVSAILIFCLGYLREKKSFEAERAELSAKILILNQEVAATSQYALYEEIQDLLPKAQAEMEQSRMNLYEKFPAELREEDQIMYVLYLEELFGTEIDFSFGSVMPLLRLNDGAILEGVTLTVNYETTYEGFKEMVNYLATDERITSIQYTTMDYDPESDTATGSLTLLCYVLNSDLTEYQEPEVETPQTGKPNILE